MRNQLYFFLLTILSFISFKTYAQELWGMTTKGGSQNSGVIFRTGPEGNDLHVVKELKYYYPGISPRGPLVQCNNGKLYGVTAQDGVFGSGILFEYDVSAKKFTKKLDFENVSNGSSPVVLIHATNDKLYGITSAGGSFGFGTLYEYDPATDGFIKLYDFEKTSTGISPACLLQATNGKLYGSAIHNTGSVIFEYSIDTHVYKPLASQYVGCPLLKQLSTGELYGITSDQQIVRFDISSGEFSIRYTLWNKGAGTITEAPNGKLYGVTYEGGENLAGYIYEYTPATNAFNIKFSFDPPNTGSPSAFGLYNTFVLAPNGKLLIPLLSTIGEFDPVASTFTKKVDIMNAIYEPFLAANGNLYGVTSDGSNATIYECDIVNNVVATLIDFHFFKNGCLPNASLARASNGKIYGVTMSGGVYSDGTLFQYDLLTDSLQTMYNFAKYATVPNGSLITGNDGKLYGVTRGGGMNNVGALFGYSPSINGIGFRDFDQTITGYGATDLMMATDGYIYGVTQRSDGGTPGKIFRYDTQAGIISAVFSFSSTFSLPVGQLVQGPNGHLYGFTTNGLLFEYDIATHTIVKTTNFSTSTDGTVPTGYSIIALNGKLYGTTMSGGQNNNGILFEFDFSTNTLTKKIDFDAINARNPSGKLTLSGNGNIYGLTSTGGSNNRGVLFEYNPATGTCLKKTDFDETNGALPIGCGLLFLNDVSHASNQAITFATIDEKTFGDPPFTLAATATSGLNVRFTSSDTSIASVLNSTVMIRKAGQVVITASQPGNASYNAAPNVEQSLIIRKAPQTLQFNAIPDKTIGDADFRVQATASSGLVAVYNTSSDKITLTGDTVRLLNAGKVTISSYQPGSDNFEASPTLSQTFNINPSQPHITTLGMSGDTITLMSDATEGNQWFLNGIPIAGATEQTLRTTQQGSYSVLVTINGCSSKISSPTDFVIAAISPTKSAGIMLSPNPAVDFVTASFKDIAGDKEVSILQTNGKILETFFATGQESTLNISKYPQGEYLLRIRSEAGTVTMKYIKK